VEGVGEGIKRDIPSNDHHPLPAKQEMNSHKIMQYIKERGGGSTLMGRRRRWWRRWRWRRWRRWRWQGWRRRRR